MNWSKRKSHLGPVSVFFVMICSVPLLSMDQIGIHAQFATYKTVNPSEKKSPNQNDLYDSLHLNNYGLSKVAFIQGLAGLNLLISTGAIHNPAILSIIDLSLPSYKKRLFVIDLSAVRLIFNTYVAHGKNSGKEMATQFSNQPRSCESSLGFYITGETYRGKHGYSLKLNGEEEGINDNAYSRGIVMHPASYVNERLAEKQGYIGRSEGCPAIPKTIHRQIIEKIKNGTCLYLYSPDKYYETHSKLMASAG
jgi:hypothetical protein